MISTLGKGAKKRVEMTKKRMQSSSFANSYKDNRSVEKIKDI